MSTKRSSAITHIQRAHTFARVGALALATLATFGALLTLTGNAGAQAALSGQWSASPMRSDWNIGEWGPACGPRPSGGGAPGGTVTVTRSGNELTMSGAGRAYSTAECWEQFPGLSRVSHSAGAQRWQTVCRTPPGDARQATVTTTLTATDTHISFDETGSYQFVVQNQNCTASVRRTRTLTALAAEDAARSPGAARGKRRTCDSPGLPERLDVRPAKRLLRRGETVEFRANVLDAAGCPLPLAPEWRLVGGKTGVRLDGPGKLVVAPDAEEGKVVLMASIADRSVKVDLEIVSSERYESLLEQGALAGPEASAEPVTRVASDSLGARGAVGRDGSASRRKSIAIGVGACALLLGLLGLFLVGRSRRRHLAREAMPGDDPRQPATFRDLGEAKVCPTCREEYPGSATYCERDGNTLVPLRPSAPYGPAGGVCPVCGQGFDPGISTCPTHQEPLVPPVLLAERTLPVSATRKICPMCGTQFDGEPQFCGNCGGTLVPVN